MAGRRTTLRLLLALLMGLLLPGAALAEPQLVAVVAADFEAAARLDAPTLRRLFLGRQTRIGGRRVRCLALPPGSPEREVFNRRVLRLDEEELARYWIEQALLGRALPPAELGSPARLLSEIRAHPGSVGYLLHEPEAPLPPGVRLLPIRD